MLAIEMKGESITLKIHIVQKGDTLWDIAKKYHVDFEQLKQLNSQLSSPDMIMPGMKIKIPSSAKSVKKEEPKAQHPYKEVPKKPMPVIKEDDHQKKKEVKKEMPLPQMPQMPQIPVQPPMMQMPVMEQEMNQYTTINMPQIPYFQEPKKEKPVKEKPKQKPIAKHEPHQVPIPQPMHMVPLCCQVYHPCYPSPPFMMMANIGGMMPHATEMHHHHPMPPMLHEYWDESPSMPEKPAHHKHGKKDCGCQGSMHMHSEFTNAPVHPYWHHTGMHDGQFMESSHMTSPYPPMPPIAHHPFPTPPGYPAFRDEEEESKSE